MRRLRRRSAPVVRRTVTGNSALVFGLHGYGSDETQLATLIPLSLPAITLVPRAPHRVEPGWGWWRPEPHGAHAELAPAPAVAAAADQIAAAIAEAQHVEAIGSARTVLVGYSQGATLALSVAARSPELLRCVVTGAGHLLPQERVVQTTNPLDVLIMNGSLDPVVSAEAHVATELAFRDAGHAVTTRVDHVPHVIDAAQARFADDWLRQHLGRA
jgi:predicted esterase